MSAWQVGPAQWRSWLDEPVVAAAPLATALDALDGRVLACLQASGFAATADVTRLEPMPADPNADPGAADDAPFDSMKTVVRPAPQREAAAGALEVALQSPDGLEVAFEDAPAPSDEPITQVSPAVEADDPELFIPTLTRPVEPEVLAAPEPEPAPPVPEPPSQAPPESSASASQTAGTISVDDDDEESAKTMTRGEIIREQEPDPIIPKARIVVDPSASGVLSVPDDDDPEELDPEELDAEDVEQLDDTAPPPGSPPPGPPPPAPAPMVAAADRPTVVETDGPPPAPAERPPPAPTPAASAADVPPPPMAEMPPPVPPATSGGTEIRPAEVPPPPSGAVPPAVTPGGTMPPVERNWVDEVFGEHYAALLPANHAVLAAQHVEFFLQSTQLAAGSRVLDVACGGGAHAIALASRGYAVTGFDASAAQIQRAQATAEAVGAPVAFVHGDMLSPPVEGPFDAALCLGSSFGVFDDEQDLLCLQRIADRLAPGGTLMLQVFNRDYMFGRLPTRSWWQGQGCLVLDEAQLHSPTSRVKIHRTIVFEDGRQFEHRYSLRGYGLFELIQACRRVGLTPVEHSGSSHTRGRFFGASSAEIWLLLRRS